MAEIYPFRALHYNPEFASNLESVVTQPYDKISPDMQARYYEANSANLVRLILRRNAPDSDESIYRGAARDFQSWIGQRILVSESQPAIYPYIQDYQTPGDHEKHSQRRGFIALCRLEDYSAGVVHRHEETLSGPKADRMELLKATRSNFGQIFMLYSDPSGAVDDLLQRQIQVEPWERAKDEYSTVHSVWRVSDSRTVEAVVEAMQPRKLVIADGHHRYETSLAYSRARRMEAPEDDRANYVMATFVRMEGPGLTILPTHRVVHSLDTFNWEHFCSKSAEFFDLTPLEVSGAPEYDASKLRILLKSAGQQHPTLVAYAGPTRTILLSLKPETSLSRVLPEYPETLARLDVTLLHGLIIERVMAIDRQAVREQKNLRYVREMVDALKEVNAAETQIAFLLNPTPIKAVCENAFAGLALPQKSTDFYPKLLSGLTIYWMDNPAGL